LTCLINYYNERTGLLDEGRAVDIVYLDFSEAFDSVSHKILMDKLLMYGLNEQTVKWIENWLNDKAQRVFNSFVNGLVDKTERTLSKFADDTKLGGAADMPEVILLHTQQAGEMC